MLTADHALAELWRAARSEKKDERERALEVALGAALAEPGAWQRLVAHFRWPGLPAGDPVAVRRQRVITEGRTDLDLQFADGRLVVLELKAGPPPGAAQLEAYAQRPEVAAVIGIARTAQGSRHPRVLGTITWGDLRHLPWPAPPLPWKQLLSLLDALGVAMHPIDATSLTGLQASWELSDQLKGWSQQAAGAAARALSGAGVEFVCWSGKKRQYTTSQRHRRLATWIWPRGWEGPPWAGLYVGFFFGRPGDPVLAGGLPDLLLTWHCNWQSGLGRALTDDPALQAALQAWRGRSAPGGVSRELWFGPGCWELIRVRSSAAALLGQPSPERAFAAWVEDRLQEWRDDGVADALRAVLARSAPGPGDGLERPPGEPDEAEAADD
jgi:hypothetical protein